MKSLYCSSLTLPSRSLPLSPSPSTYLHLTVTMHPAPMRKPHTVPPSYPIISDLTRDRCFSGVLQFFLLFLSLSLSLSSPSLLIVVRHLIFFFFPSDLFHVPSLLVLFDSFGAVTLGLRPTDAD